MNNRERFLRTMRYEDVDRRPLNLAGPWRDTLERWYREGLPRGKNPNEELGLQPLRVANVSGQMALHPPYETRTVEETETFRVAIDRYGRTVRDFKDHTSMPEWLSFPVTDRESLQRLLDEHYCVDRLDERFGPEWEKRIVEAAAKADLVMIDGGCYYWTLRSVAGVECASYLFYDAPDLVDELFERYCTVVLEGMRRASELVKIDLVGFGEDIAFKTGTLISPDMFRRMILPRYRRAMTLARSFGADLTWYDSDGDVRAFIPDYLSVGINTVSPCEVAAGMDPVGLRETFGRDLRMIGGIDKREIARGRAAIEAEIARKAALIREGGFMPGIDHSVSSDISWDNYRYYIETIQRALVM